MQHIRAEAPFFQRARPKILDQDIGCTDQAFEDLLPLLKPQIQRYGLLVAGNDGPEDTRLIYLHGAPVTGGIGPVGGFDLNHFGAKIAEQLATKRARNQLSQLKHAQAGQRRLYNRFCHSHSMPAKYA